MGTYNNIITLPTIKTSRSMSVSELLLVDIVCNISLQYSNIIDNNY